MNKKLLLSSLWPYLPELATVTIFFEQGVVDMQDIQLTTQFFSITLAHSMHLNVSLDKPQRRKNTVIPQNYNYEDLDCKDIRIKLRIRYDILRKPSNLSF
jgi:hypothetical protein